MLDWRSKTLSEQTENVLLQEWAPIAISTIEIIAVVSREDPIVQLVLQQYSDAVRDLLEKHEGEQ